MENSKVFEYESDEVSTENVDERDLLEGCTNGLKWSWKSSIIGEDLYLSWRFDWNDLRKDGIYGFKGRLSAVYCTSYACRKGFELELKQSREWIHKKIGIAERCKVADSQSWSFSFSFTLKASRGEALPPTLVQNFVATELTDAVLVVEEHKLHVNKAFLSSHSDFFNSLFSSDFKEKSMAEIPIKDVYHEDLVCLLSVIQPQDPFVPTRRTTPMLLELAERFLMPKVTQECEKFLIWSQRTSTKEKIRLGDKHSLTELLGYCMELLNTQEKLKTVVRSDNYNDFSVNTKALLLDHFRRLMIG
ncbi:unnamed protein product [Caenorhabditis sp. 36 PRJEB53466]|nr:unnamed protein product [Caenorhabditis sp. 36 PRJEB53466]